MFSLKFLYCKEVYCFKILRMFQVRFNSRSEIIYEYIEQKSLRHILKQISSTVLFLKTVFYLLLSIHLFSWFWMYLNNYQPNESIFNYYLSCKLSIFQSNRYIGYYFITTTFTTVGYGEFLPYNNIQIIFIMFTEFWGLAIFSYMIGILTHIQAQKSSHTIINEKQDLVMQFLQKINENRKDFDLPNEVINKALENIEIIYKYQLKNVITNNDYFSSLKPRQINNLIVSLFSKHYLNFRDFFYNKNPKFEACDGFISRFLVHLEWQIFYPGMNIVNRGEQIDTLYLIEDGIVAVTEHKFGRPMAYLPRFSFFGDYQIFLNICSNVSFTAGLNTKVILFCISKDRFIYLWKKFEGHYRFFFERALATRRLFKKLRLEL